MNRVLAPKACGAWNLHRLTLRQPLDFFVLFSSAAAWLGAPGQANYVAANAFLDALAAYRQRLGLHGLSLAWGAWDQVGMTAKEGLIEKLRRGSEEPIPVAKGLDLFDELLNEPASQIGVMPIDWVRFSKRRESTSPMYEKLVAGLESHGSGGSMDVSDAKEIQRTLREAAVEDRPTILEAHLRAVIAQLLDIDAATLPNEDGVGFVSLGLDSLSSIELRNTLQRTLNCSLPVTFSFDYPTIEAAVNYLSQSVLTPICNVPRGNDTPRGQSSAQAAGDEGLSLSDALQKLAAYLE